MPYLETDLKVPRPLFVLDAKQSIKLDDSFNKTNGYPSPFPSHPYLSVEI
jgi:hypothetical protein